MMKGYLLIAALCMFMYAGAGHPDNDSLLQVVATTRDDVERIRALEGLSYNYLDYDQDSALLYAEKGLELAKKVKSLWGESICNNALGNVYFHLGDYPKSLELYFKSLQFAEKTGNTKSLPVRYFNIASVYTEQEDYLHAVSYISKAMHYDELGKDTSGIMFDMYSLASNYLRLQRNDSALYFIQLAHQLALKVHEENMMGAILNTYGETYLAMQNYEQAAIYFRQSVAYTIALNDIEVLAANYFGIAKIANISKQYDSSIFYCRKALQTAQDGQFLKKVLETSTFLSALFKQEKRFDSAFHYQELGMVTRDSLFNVDKIKKVQNLKLAEQQRQQAIQTAKIEFWNKVRLYLVLGAALALLIISYLLWKNNKQKRNSLTLLQNEKSLTEAAYKELKTTQAQLIQSEKMASLGELTSGIAHEIQNPLNFVNNFSEVSRELIDELKKIKSNPDSYREKTEEQDEILNDIDTNLERISHHGKRAEAIVKGMLQHSRKSSGTKELTDINQLADEYLRIAYHGIQAKDRNFKSLLVTNFDSSIKLVNIIPEDIGRVLMNLYNNAFYAVNEKKKSYELSAESYEPVVSIQTKKIADKIEIKVKDNGNGMPQKIIDKIFQPFFTTKPTGEGTGLGLSLSYDIVKTHGGEISVATKENEGTEFTIILPAT